MRVDTVIKWFMPKEERYHALLAHDTENLVRSARLFSEIAHSPSLEERRVKAVQLKALEHDGDQITRRVFETLNSTFITPLDREDIRSIARDLDDILDYLESVAQHLILFELGDSPAGLRQFAQILVAMVEQIDQATGLLWNQSDGKRIHQALVRISELENQGDKLYNTVIGDLFNSKSLSPTDILKWKEVYEELEDACDQCKDFSHVLGNVVIKNA
jgi:predicted phosphate transport protein (TIGR00153 family)